MINNPELKKVFLYLIQEYNLENDLAQRVNSYFARFEENESIEIKWILEEFRVHKIKMSDEDMKLLNESIDGRI